MANSNLTNAKKAKNDEFYTQFPDIQKEIEAYLEYDPDTFRDKIVYSNCDDPFESNFFRYFVLNFKRLGLKQYIATSYRPSPIANTQLGLFGDDKTLPLVKGRPKVTANRFIINDVGDINDDGSFSLKDIAEQLRSNKDNEWQPLEGDGDFRSDECVELLKQSDIVVTNPPFSLFREYIKQLFDFDKKFLIIGNLNAITYKEVFPRIKNNEVWLGNNARVNGGAMFYEIPESVVDMDKVREVRIGEDGRKIYITRVQGVRWFTNLDHGRRHQPIPLMTWADNRKFNKSVVESGVAYKPYDNYDAIEVSLVKNIPSNCDGTMGVPVSFLDKYSPEQFEIIGASDNGAVDEQYKLPHFKKHNEPYVDGKKQYKRIFIRHRRSE